MKRSSMKKAGYHNHNRPPFWRINRAWARESLAIFYNLKRSKMIFLLSKLPRNYISLKQLWLALPKVWFYRLPRICFQYQHQASKQDTHSHKHSPLTKRVLRSYSIMREHTQGIDWWSATWTSCSANRWCWTGLLLLGREVLVLIAREMKLRFMRLGVVCEAP